MTAIVLTLLGWSIVPLILRYFSEGGHYVDFWTSNGWRYGFSALLWTPAVLLGVRRGTIPQGLWRKALVPSLINAIAQVCFTWAHYKIDPGLLTFGLRFQIVFVAIGAYILFANERRVVRSAMYIVGFVLVLGGSLVTVVFGAGLPTGQQAFGVVLAISSGLFFASYGLAVRYFMHEINPIIAFSVISLYTAGAMIVLMLVMGERGGLSALDLSAWNMTLLLGSAVIGIALGHVGYYTAIARLGVATCAGAIQVQPFIVGVMSAMLYHERLTWVQWVAGVVATFGAVLMLSVQHRLTRTAEAEAAAADDAR